MSFGSNQTENQTGPTLALLYERYAGWLTGRLRKLYGDAAEDLVQETYLRIAPYQSQGTIQHPKALLLRIARNIAVDQSRKLSAATAYQACLSSSGHRDAQQLDDLITKQAILSLPDDVRDVFVLSRVVGLTCQEVASRTGLSVKAVEWRLSRALIHCAAHLER